MRTASNVARVDQVAHSLHLRVEGVAQLRIAAAAKVVSVRPFCRCKFDHVPSKNVSVLKARIPLLAQTRERDNREELMEWSGELEVPGDCASPPQT